MQDYREFAKKNGIDLLDEGPCQFCGASTQRAVHECLERFNLGFELLDFSEAENHLYRFLSVDAHTLQHSEIHGRWNNHFHLCRLHLILERKVAWTYKHSPRLSDFLKAYKRDNPDAYWQAPQIGSRGDQNIVAVQQGAGNANESRILIRKWAQEVYNAWQSYHEQVRALSQDFYFTA